MKSVFVTVPLLLALAGCAGPTDVASLSGSDTPEKAEALAAETAKAAGQNPDNPERAATNTLLQKSASHLAETLAERLSNEDSRTRVSIYAQAGEKPSGTILNVHRIGEDKDGKTDFVQSSLFYKPNRATINVGLGRRFLSNDEQTLSGVNAFFDYSPNYGHQRGSVGFEVKRSAFEITGNQYFRMTGWKTGLNGNKERAMNGREIEIGGQVPYMPDAKIFVKQWKWKGVSEIKGKTYSLQLAHFLGPNVMFEAGTKDFDGATKSVNFAKVTYSIRTGEVGDGEGMQPLISDEMFANKSMKAHVLDEVRRSNEIVYETEFSSKAGGI